ncbi:MAG: calcium-binding protein [Hyphomicrobiaceae bacterium]
MAILIGNAKKNTLIGTAASDTIRGLGGNDILQGLQGNDLLYGGTGNDTLTGGDGHDKMWGDAGHDTMRGGSGNDTMEGGAGNDKMYGDSGKDNLKGGSGVDVLKAGADNDKLDGGTSNDKLYGGAGNDTLIGGSGNDLLDGGGDNDKLDGGSGDDTLKGNSGNDILYHSAGSDAFYGGSGTDTVSYANATSGVSIDLDTGATSGAASGDTFSSIEIIIGTQFDDALHGGAGDDTLYGGLDNDDLKGGGGADTLNGGTDDDGLAGEDGDDVLTGGTGVDTFMIDLGTDTITDLGRGGSDIFIVTPGATLNATLAENYAATDQSVSAGAVLFILAGHDIDLSAITTGGTWDITNAGNATGVTVQGCDFLDVVTGGDGSDYFIVSAGSDTYNGGGDGAFGDTLDFSNAAGGVNFNLGGSSTQSVFSFGSITFSGIENIVGTVNYDILTGDAGANIIVGGENGDLLVGGGGSDIFSYESIDDSAVGNTDVIADFDDNAADRLDLSEFDLGFSFIGTAAFTALDATPEVRYYFDVGDTRVEIDVDGDDTADMEIVLQNGNFALDLSDFIL